jgi:hypothetical protein
MQVLVQAEHSVKRRYAIDSLDRELTLTANAQTAGSTKAFCMRTASTSRRRFAGFPVRLRELLRHAYVRTLDRSFENAPHLLIRMV